MKRFLILFLLLFFTLNFAFSYDFGLIVDNQIEVIEDVFTYTPGITPWFSWNNGEGISVFLSALLSLKYINYSGDLADADSGFVKPGLIAEIARFAFSYQISQTISLEAGRINYSDVLDFTASGLFDGLRFNIHLPAGSISAGAYYTGLLYRETAEILMTSGDIINYSESWNYSGNLGEYFASRRLLFNASWDMPFELSEKDFTISAEVLAQFDLNNNNNDIFLNSQYGALKMEFYPSSMFRITGGFLVETMQYDNGEGKGEEFGLALGALAQAKMALPTPLEDWLSFMLKLTTASIQDKKVAFTPISCLPQGSVFEEPLRGLALIEALYSVMLVENLFAECAMRYFICTYDNSSNDGNLYGAEFWVSAVWQYFDDIQVNLGGGVFLPSLGNVDSGGDMMWKITAGVTLSF